MKILITGGSGLVGSAIKDITREKYNNNNKYIFISSKEYDLTKIDETKICFEKYKPDMVIHLASVVYGATYGLETQFNSLIDNSKINLNVFECCSIFSVKKIITCLSVVLSNKDKNIDTNSILDGPELDLNFHQGYAHSKRLLHNLCISYQKADKGHIILLTPVNIYGYQDIDTSNRLIPSIIRSIKNDKEINLSSQSVRQLLYNNDLANIILEFVNINDNLFKQSSLYPYIVGNPTLLRSEEIVFAICNKLNIDAKTIKFNEKKNFSRTVNISHLPFKFNYTTFEKSINDIFDIYHKNVISLIT
jgi:GDP-L-fucose synthase